MSATREPSKRSQQLSDLVHRALALCLQRETNDPRLHKMSITEVDVSPDLRRARIYYTLLDTTELSQIEKALLKGARFLRQCLAERTELRYVPQLEFLYDHHLRHAESLSHLISQIDMSDKTDDC